MRPGISRHSSTRPTYQWPEISPALLATLLGLGASGYQLPAGAGEGFSIGLPLACRVGESCWVANYVDVDKGTGARDFLCRSRTYDGHKGVDFAIRDLGVMAQGIPVVAAAGGVVKGVRDGMEDIAIDDETSRARIKGRECGNGVVLQHEGKWQTQYCHMRKGSLGVKQGERVEAGRQLGLVGLSGQTEFPHVHLEVRQAGTPVDPFTGKQMGAGCGLKATPLWRAGQKIEYEPVALYNVGFAAGKPDIDAIRNGRRDDGPFPVTSHAIVLWVDAFGVQAGDRVRFLITGPDGRAVFEHEQRMQKTQARSFQFAGGRLRGNLTAGTYRGEVTLTRQGDDGRTIRARVTTSVALK